MGGPAQGAHRPQLCEDGGLGRDRIRRPAGQALTPRDNAAEYLVRHAGVVDGNGAYFVEACANHVEGDLL